MDKLMADWISCVPQGYGEVKPMSRYIDADKVLKIVNDMTECEDDYERITECVNNMPSIDIINCIDCRLCSERGGHANCNGYLICTLFNRVVDEDTYCAWGERIR